MVVTCELPDGIQAIVTASDRLEVLVGPAKRSFPFPDRGLAHLELSASASGRYIVIQHCSGQGEESYRVLDRHADLATVASADFIYGETNSVGFSDDERVFVAAIPSVCTTWWEHLDPPGGTDEAGRGYFEFGTLLTHDLEAITRTSTSLRVSFEDDWSTDQQPYDPHLRPTFASSSVVTLDLPWGTETLRFPFGDVVWLRPPG